MECSLPAVDDQEDESREPQDNTPLDIPEHYTLELAKRHAFSCHLLQIQLLTDTTTCNLGPAPCWMLAGTQDLEGELILLDSDSLNDGP